jgi:hypothetical protein
VGKIWLKPLKEEVSNQPVGLISPDNKETGKKRYGQADAGKAGKRINRRLRRSIRSCTRAYKRLHMPM